MCIKQQNKTSHFNNWPHIQIFRHCGLAKLTQESNHGTHREKNDTTSTWTIKAQRSGGSVFSFIFVRMTLHRGQPRNARPVQTLKNQAAHLSWLVNIIHNKTPKHSSITDGQQRKNTKNWTKFSPYTRSLSENWHQSERSKTWHRSSVKQTNKHTQQSPKLVPYLLTFS